MKRMRIIVWIVALIVVVPVIAWTQYSVVNYREQGGAKWVVGGEIEVEGTFTETETEVALSSGLTTFTVLNTRFVTLTVNPSSNLTGIIPVYGLEGQTVRIRSGAAADSADTMRFDDGTSMTIGANITLTEGEGDHLTLRCTTSDGDEWEAVSAHDN